MKILIKKSQLLSFFFVLATLPLGLHAAKLLDQPKVGCNSLINRKKGIAKKRSLA